MTDEKNPNSAGPGMTLAQRARGSWNVDVEAQWDWLVRGSGSQPANTPDPPRGGLPPILHVDREPPLRVQRHPRDDLLRPRRLVKRKTQAEPVTQALAHAE